MVSGGEELRRIREQLGLTIRDVEAGSNRIAERYRDQSFAVSLSRLSDIEAKSVVPSIHKLYSLAVIYRRDFHELLMLYGINAENYASDLAIAGVNPKKSHRFSLFDRVPKLEMPVELDPAFDLAATTDIGRMVVRWGVVPLRMLSTLKSRKFIYGYIGAEDLTMYPLILPGSFIQIDESRNKVVHGKWRSEFERPIYFVETRQGFSCSWCELNGAQLTLRSHPLSSVQSRVLRLGSEAEVIGQVVGVAMRLDHWLQPEREQEE